MKLIELVKLCWIIAIGLILAGIAARLGAQELPPSRGCWQDDIGSIMHCPTTKESCTMLLGERHHGKWVRYNCPEPGTDFLPPRMRSLRCLFGEPDASDPPVITMPTDAEFEAVISAFAATEDPDLHVYLFDITAPGYVIKTAARSDGTCPYECNSTIRVRVLGKYGNDDTYGAVTGVRSTGQLDIVLDFLKPTP